MTQVETSGGVWLGVRGAAESFLQLHDARCTMHDAPPHGNGPRGPPPFLSARKQWAIKKFETISNNIGLKMQRKPAITAPWLCAGQIQPVLIYRMCCTVGITDCCFTTHDNLNNSFIVCSALFRFYEINSLTVIYHNMIYLMQYSTLDNCSLTNTILTKP